MSIAVDSKSSWLCWFAFWQWPFGPGGVRRMTLLAIAGILATCVSYWFTYRSTVLLGACIQYDPVAMTKTIYAEPGYAIQAYLPQALWDYTPIVFAPAHQVDRWLRPQLWLRHTSPLTNEEKKEMLSDFTPEEIQELEAQIGRSLGEELSH